MHSLIFCVTFLPLAFTETRITPYTTDENGVVTFAVSIFSLFNQTEMLGRTCFNLWNTCQCVRGHPGHYHGDS